MFRKTLGMGTNFRPFKARILSLGQQSEGLKREFPASKINLSQNGKLVWIGRVQPSPLSATYTVQLAYHVGKRPVVQVVEPALETREGERLPHIFGGKALCLYRTIYGEWNAAKLISKTIIPWTALWLHHYEIWLATGVWCGSKSEHPPY